ncbi:aldehyde dehydrogenase family protein [Bosea massiliensis]|uniref:Aldehyde dehydrogenase family protein n=1 Tax=Bosea massiliensis TaxID=151419 RepID=A0ABW0PD31_9HYPH
MLDKPAPVGRGLYYGGEWRHPISGRYAATSNPGLDEPIAEVAEAGVSDVDAAVKAARQAFLSWRGVAPLERARLLKEVAAVVRANARELAALDAANCGNPVREMLGDATIAAAQLDYFAGLVTEMKGETIPMGPDVINMTLRQPLGVVARILAFNHPFMFCAGKIAAPLAAGNAVIVKPPEQAPLSSLRLAELVQDILPRGVFSVLPGGREAGAALASHPGVDKIAIIGSVGAGRAVMKAASDTIKPVLLELGGKNALIAFPDAAPATVASAMIGGMNFTWCGQSCGSTSRAFIHRDIYEDVLSRLPSLAGHYVPGLPTDDRTTMGAIISRQQHERVLEYIASAKEQGARLVTGGAAPGNPALAKGFYVEPTIFADVTPAMRIAREEIFGPVLAVLPWDDETTMLSQVNEVEYGLTCSIWTNDLRKAHRTALAVEAGFVWVNEVSKHFIGAPFGGWKQSGLGREECLGELLAFTQEKNVHVSLRGG